MTSEIKADKWSPASGTAGTIGDSGDTFTVPTGVGLTVTDEVKTNKISPASGTAFTMGDSGDTFTIPSGVTFANSGTATGFGALVHITSQAFPAANNFTIDSVFSTDYVNYIMTINMLNCSTDDSCDFVFVKSGTPDTGSNYRFTNKGYQNDGNSTDNYSNGTTTYGSLLYNMDADSEAGASGTFTIYSPFAAYQRKAVMGVSAVPKGTANNLTPFYTASDYHNGTTQQFTGIKFQSRIGHNFRAGSVAGGYSTVSIYGVKNS